MSTNKSNSDPYFECPYCGSLMRPTGDNPVQTNDLYGEIQSYGCVTCGHIAVFVKKTAEGYIESKRS